MGRSNEPIVSIVSWNITIPVYLLVTVGFIMINLIETTSVLFEGPSISSSQQQQQQQQTIKKTYSNRSSNKPIGNNQINLVEADENGLYLVGLFDIHHSNPRVPFKCGQIDIDSGEWQSRRPLQNLEAFLWAIEQVNADKSLLPGIRLGSLVLDTCSSFLKTNQQLANLLHNQHELNRDLPDHRQIMAIVADNQDWPTVEAVVSMASALGLTTFVTQSRSSKLGELVRKYNSIGASSYQDSPINDLKQQNPIGTDTESDELRMGNQFEGLLGELTGIGKMTTPVYSGNETIHPNPSAATDNQPPDNRLYMIRMLLGNEILADAIASLVQQMSWDLISIVYDDELDMVDLHDELAKQLFARNIQLALDEQILISSPMESYHKLLNKLASKTQIGSRVVISLLGTGSSRQLLSSLARLRQSKEKSEDPIVSQVNSVLWITVSDREPYYSYATNALGTIVISNAVNLIPDFRSYYDKLASDSQHLARNRWWSEYLKTILVRHNKDIELTSNECAKWQEPLISPLRERCRSLSLSGLVQLEQKSQLISKPLINRKSTTTTTTTTKPKLSKYLAGGWEHNGMDVINSVLSIANGLESVRQTLCPGKASGICEEMREFITPTNETNSSSDPLISSEPLPMMSELIYNELLRSTFQLADGRMFNLLDESSSAISLISPEISSQAINNRLQNSGSQLDGKFKLFNLRYLQPNSIGFVKFGTFDQQDGLIINSSKALHYPIDSDYKNQVLIEKVKSTCQDPSKCLMLGQFLNGADDELGKANSNNSSNSDATDSKRSNNQASGLSEEDLASGLNSLFKLDHPLIVSQQQQSSHLSSDAAAVGTVRQTQADDLSSGGSGIASKQTPMRANEQQADKQKVVEPKTHTMRWQPQISDHFHWPDESPMVKESSPQKLDKPEKGLLSFEVIVLLPLHNKLVQQQSNITQGETNRSSLCSPELNLDSSFQHLVALAYAQSMINGRPRQQQQKLAQISSETSDSKQIEMTTTVIDYCDQVDLAKAKLTERLSRQSSTSGRKIALIDFEENISEQVKHLVVANNLLHLTIGSSTGSGYKPEATTKKDTNNNDNHLRLSLMPSKTNEIRALIGVISAMPDWKLVHLIYTDHHHYRDEFVRRANEANICVSKLIWIPSIAAASSPEHLSSQLEKTKSLFSNELHDYSRFSSAAARSHSNNSEPDNTASNDSEGLSSTRVLVILASSDAATNKLILEASSDSMLQDYVWLTSHEWLNSIEKQAELQQKTENNNINNRKSLVRHLFNSTIRGHLPRYFLSTRFEAHESHEFRHYFSTLSPSIHRPIPTEWFDQFWQQMFTCRLPLPGNSAGDAQIPLCKSNQHLSVHDIVEDDRVHFVIRAIKSLDFALKLVTANRTADDQEFSSLELMKAFKRSFEETDVFSQSYPYGFQIIHRLLSARSADGSRRQNSRELDQESSNQLLKVGIWRNGELILANRSTSDWSMNQTDQLEDDAADTKLMQKSLTKMASIVSSCSTLRTCNLCSQQIDQTHKLFQLEEARLTQSQSSGEPKAISSIDFSAGKNKSKKERRKLASILDLPSSPLEYDDQLNATKDDVVLASASSLFDTVVKKQLIQQQEADLRHSHDRILKARLSASNEQQQQRQQYRYSSELIGIASSLVGIVCIMASMIHLYPTTLQKGSLGIRDSLYGSEMTLFDERKSISSIPNNNINSYQTNVNITSMNDYSLLIGLLMLYSINVSFILPATISVCWFRRIGLATSYTVIFSSILAQVLTNAKDQLKFKEPKCKKSVDLDRKSAQMRRQIDQHPQSAAIQSNDEPTEDSEVELTFESLPPINDQVLESQQPDSLTGHNRRSSVTEVLDTTCTNRYQVNSDVMYCHQSENPVINEESIRYRDNRLSSSIPSIVSICLIFIQIVVSFVWLIEQPPEPTLYNQCWYCTSPHRSQTLFFYEIPLSLLYPASILILAWLSSLVYFRIASKNESIYSSMKSPMVTAQKYNTTTSIYQTRLEEENLKLDLNFKLRDSRSLVMTTTLIIISWSIMILKMISSDNVKLQPATKGINGRQQQQQQQLVLLLDCNTALVYSNIISGAIVFIVLFVYRQQLIHLNPMRWKIGKRSNKSPTGMHAQDPSSRFRTISAYGWSQSNDLALISSDRQLSFNRSVTNDGNPTSMPVAHINGQHERFGLRQFNSSYGTYNSGSQFDPSPLNCHHHQGNTIHETNDVAVVGARKEIKKKNKKIKSSFFGTSKSSSATSLTSDRKSNKLDQSSVSGRKLQRRQSSGSVASSTAQLVSSHDGIESSIIDTDDLVDDTISCASSVGSSQLHGNDLYPIDCSIQLDSQMAEDTLGKTVGHFSRSASFRRQSIRRSKTKLSSVSEEHN